jgi:hypothetical protein
MAFVPPWLSFGPLDFVHAAAQGAGLGLQRAQIDTGANEAADRLRLSYAQLAAEQEKAQMAEQASQEREHAALVLHNQAQKSAMDRFNQGIAERAAEHAASLGLQRDKAAQLQDYRTNRLDQFGTEEDRRQSALDLLTGYRTNRLQQFGTGLSETARHHDAMETISADKAAAALQRGEAAPITFPEFPGMTFIKQPSGAILKVESAVRQPTVSLDADGKFKGASGALGSPAMRNLIGTNSLPGFPNNPNQSWEPPPNLGSPAGASLMIPAPQAPQLFNPPKARVFKDGSGKAWTYTGNADDPATDQNPDNWQSE